MRAAYQLQAETACAMLAGQHPQSKLVAPSHLAARESKTHKRSTPLVHQLLGFEHAELKRSGRLANPSIRSTAADKQRPLSRSAPARQSTPAPHTSDIAQASMDVKGLNEATAPSSVPSSATLEASRRHLKPLLALAPLLSLRGLDVPQPLCQLAPFSRILRTTEHSTR